ncbi:hypothetical protein K432DRAFT_390567 [Lepidopterella palustris CBS 459.81]|uniref:Amino acid permease/ SLC12A domain-containing protein n=1 Tax=Lepidopterella palustris CBS 459.81 TaxID=1314670 RepID=A0A8E2EFR2_9PEZI|nr:hypothetical protein K432DRAFT_390567 [Lepidopterella palustris CBS 459.81]
MSTVINFVITALVLEARLQCINIRCRVQATLVAVNAPFTYVGAEIVGQAFAGFETPRKNVPKPVKEKLCRTILFYTLGVFAFGLAIPSDNPHFIGNRDHSAAVFVPRAANPGTTLRQ